MPYRVFISTTNDQQGQMYARTVQHTLWNLKDFPVAPITMEDLAETNDNPEEMIRQILDETDIFIGVYCTSYGEYKHLKLADLIEYEYAYAVERGIQTLIFISIGYDSSDQRLTAFKESLKVRQIVHTFDTEEELRAKVIVAVTNFRQHSRKLPPIAPPLPHLSAPSQEQIDTVAINFEQTARRAFDLLEDDIENVVRRAIALQQAHSNLAPPPLKGAGHEMQVNPIFGQPNPNSQFHSDIFMIMPFREEYDAIYHNMIVPTVADLNLTIKRGDEFSSVSGKIIGDVWAAINACRLVIVETSVENANVYYELGIAHTLGKPAILITQGKSIEDFPFDIRHLRFIVYENTIAGGEKLEDDLRKSLIWILNDLDDGM